ncbi:hypothetical protein Sjap_025134 [Stephania japonica]|uniref:Metallo-beta-lactamase domain-containing protein n=1 Tax=Stephania japonica TaxID=461633 RepID=A0AAP0E4A4_9MAGN
MNSSLTLTTPPIQPFHRLPNHQSKYPSRVSLSSPQSPPHNNNGGSLVLLAYKGTGGFLSAVDRAIEEEEYRKARAEVTRKGIELEGYSIEGVSIGGHETCIILPRLNSAFDIGRCPSRAVNQDYLFITHAHLDHIGGLPMYVATRGLYNLKPPTIFVPPCIKEDVEKLFEVHRSMSQVELELELVALDIDVILSPEVAFTGDTTSDFLLDPRSADALRAKVLIMEIMEHVQWIRNKAVLLTHFSPRYKIEEIREAVLKLQPKVPAKVVALTEGFKSRYSS